MSFYIENIKKGDMLELINGCFVEVLYRLTTQDAVRIKYENGIMDTVSKKVIKGYVKGDN